MSNTQFYSSVLQSCRCIFPKNQANRKNKIFHSVNCIFCLILQKIRRQIKIQILIDKGDLRYEGNRNSQADRRPRTRRYPKGDPPYTENKRRRPVTDNIDTVAEFLRKYRQVCRKARAGVVHINEGISNCCGYLRRVCCYKKLTNSVIANRYTVSLLSDPCANARLSASVLSATPTVKFSLPSVVCCDIRKLNLYNKKAGQHISCSDILSC